MNAVAAAPNIRKVALYGFPVNQPVLGRQSESKVFFECPSAD